MIAESLAYSLYESYGVECWQIAQENFSVLQSNLNEENAHSIMSRLYLNQFGFRCGKWLVNDLKYLFRSISAGSIEDKEFLGYQTAWIVVLRKDIVSQAISSAYAKISGVYHHYGSSEVSDDVDLELSYEDVRIAFREILTSNYYLNAFARKVKRGCLVYYEDYTEDPKRELTRIIQELNMPLDLDCLRMVQAKLTPTAQQGKSEWRERFDDFFLPFP